MFVLAANLPNGQAGAQTIWYIDRDATGSANGTSWANAWNTFEQISWGSISAGDTIYVSGGADSTAYKPTTNNSGSSVFIGTLSNRSFASGNPVIVTNAWHSNHNGTVYITGVNQEQSRILEIYGISNLKVSGLTIVDHRTAFWGFSIFIGNNDSLVTLQDCHYIGNGHNYGVYLASHNLTVRNCILENLENSFDDPQDLFGIAGGKGGVTIEGCKIILRGTSLTTEEHADGIQFSNYGDGSTTVDNIIRNNLIIQMSDNSAWNAMVYSSNPQTKSNFYIYNNVFVSNNTVSSVGGLFLYQPDENPANEWTLSIYALNNTMILNSPSSGLSQPFTIDGRYLDTLVIKNNIVTYDNPISYFMNIRPFSHMEGGTLVPDVYHREVDYNAYSQLGGISGSTNFYPGERFGAWTLAEWLADTTYGGGWDAHSLFQNSTAVYFGTRTSTNINDYYTTTGRDLGVDLSIDNPDLVAKFPDIAYDILGNPRTGAWDMGALEYQGGQSNNINVNGKVFLQGPFNTNFMRTDLGQGGLLPNNQPFNTAPWNYNGNESLGSGSSSSYVDWVLVELRNSSNPSEVAARKAAILKNDGTLLNSNGNTGVTFNNLAAGSYYVAVFHRNHLAVMSSVPVQLSANTPTYDFTTGLNKAFGQNPMKELAPGKYGMYAGDGNSDGGITITDRNDVWAIQNGSMGYLKGDFNLDGGVTASDVNLYWNINNGTMTQVP